MDFSQIGVEVISLVVAIILSGWIIQASMGVVFIIMPEIADKPVTKREILNWLFNPAYAYYRLYKLFKKLK